MGGEGVAQRFDVVVQEHGDAVDVGGQGLPQLRIAGLVEVDGVQPRFLEESTHPPPHGRLADDEDRLWVLHGQRIR